MLCVVAFALIGVSAVKWRLFLSHLGQEVSLTRLFGLYLVGYFVNLLMPSYVGGDIVRSLYVGGKENRSESLSATFLERYTGLVAMVLIAVCSLPFAPFVTWQIAILAVGVAIGLLVVSVILFSERSIVLLRRFIPEKCVKIVERFQAGIRFGVKDPKLLCQAFLLSLVFHFLTVINTAAVAYAVGWYNPPIFDLLVVVPLILLVGAIPVAPSGLGITEGAFYFFLHGIGATPEQAVGIGLVLRAKGYILAVLGGIVWLAIKRDKGQVVPLAAPAE